MGIIQQLEGDLKAAMVAKENDRRDTLRLVLADMKNKKIELLLPVLYGGCACNVL